MSKKHFLQLAFPIPYKPEENCIEYVFHGALKAKVYLCDWASCKKALCEVIMPLLPDGHRERHASF